MVLKTQTCRFSGLRIYPGHGSRLTKMDSSTFLFLNSKCKRLFNQRLKPAKLAWTMFYRKAHKKDQATEAKAKKRKIAKNSLNRSIGSVSLEVIQKKRGEKSEVRAAARDAALREIKERLRKSKDEKKSKKSAEPKKAAPPAKGGKGGKR